MFTQFDFNNIYLFTFERTGHGQVSVKLERPLTLEYNFYRSMKSDCLCYCWTYYQSKLFDIPTQLN